MKKKDFVLSIILNAFLGYLWILFVDHIVGIANSMENVFFIGGIIIVIGTFLFFEIVKRITPFNEYKNTHPIKLAGFTSFLLVVIGSVLT
ncbi:hypothetical protein [Bacillus sp. EB01]|uniref:hypothetical protein n=1 Tax=Bacillus sp. EB01 TaxID=1347086 RepID=UPI0005C594A4|nr:hypothetical protein [Bacillus sp. EB01]